MTGIFIRLLAVVAIATGMLLFLFLAADEPAAKTRPVTCQVTAEDVAFKRSRTWRWQTELGETRTPTAYAERYTTSCAYRKWQYRRWSQRAREGYRLVVRMRDPRFAIAWVFGEYYGEQAIRVAYCESRLTLTAQNGQYRGLFQMGSSERQLFGHGDTAIEQARAAKRYFVLSGRDWSPWSCRWAA